MKKNDFAVQIHKLINNGTNFILQRGDALSVIKSLPNKMVDCVITSPPYWNLREYDIKNKHKSIIIGDEIKPSDYVRNLVEIFSEIKSKLKDGGSIWLNLGDKYNKKNLMGMPWRVALAMQEDGWILRNDIIWDQIKGTQSAKDRMRDVYEHIFHFVKNRKYYYDDKSIRIKPAPATTSKNGTLLSATGVSGVKYRKQIIESKLLTSAEKKAATAALDKTLERLKCGEIVDFRMTIKGNQRVYHSDRTRVSGRAKELKEKGYYILTMKASGFLPSDIWRIVPEDKWRKDTHCAVFPEELLTMPIKATCPENGIVLDPFCGTSSTVAAALKLKRKGIGIDISDYYIKVSRKRINEVSK